VIGVAFYVHRTRQRRAEVETDTAFDVEQGQIQGPPIMVQQPEAATTYGAPYAMASAPTVPRPLQLSAAAGSAPVPPHLTLNLHSPGVPSTGIPSVGIASAGIATGGGLRSPNPYGYQSNTIAYPQTAPGNRAVFGGGIGSSSARGDGRYPFTGISSSVSHHHPEII
jgi:hypothetical protein